MSSCTCFTVTMRLGSLRNASSSCDALAARAYVPPVVRAIAAQRRLVDLEEVAATPDAQVDRYAAAADRLERVTAELLGGARQRGGVGRAESDREHAHPAVGRLPRRVPRVDPGGRRAVGEQDDDVGDVAAGEAVLAPLGGRERHRARRDVGVHPRQRVDRGEHTVADRGAERGAEAVDGAVEPVTVGGGRHEDLRAGREHDDPESRAAGLVVHELARRVLRRRQAVRTHVGRAHRTGHVDREHDRGVAPRRGHQCLRTRHRDHQRDDRREEERRGHEPPPPRALGHRLLDQREAGVRDRELAPPSPQPEVRRDHQQRHEQPQERVRPEEPQHQIARPYQRSESPAAIRKQSSPTPAKIAVISVLRPLIDNLRSIELYTRWSDAASVAAKYVPPRAFGHAAQEIGVERGGHLVAVDVDDGTTGAADADREDPHARLRGDRRQRHRIELRGVVAVGQEHDGRRTQEADVGLTAAVLERVAVEHDRLARNCAERGEDPAPERRTAAGRQPIDRCAHLLS